MLLAKHLCPTRRGFVTFISRPLSRHLSSQFYLWCRFTYGAPVFDSYAVWCVLQDRFVDNFLSFSDEDAMHLLRK